MGEDFPNAAKLWSGSRKDIVVGKTGFLMNMGLKIWWGHGFYEHLFFQGKVCKYFFFQPWQVLEASQEKNDLLKAWLASGENIKVMETKLVIQKSQEGKLTRGRELLTISEMKARGFSQYLGF